MTVIHERTRSPLRRNDVVLREAATAWWVFGRVWKRIDDEHVAVVDTMRRVTKVRDADLRRSSAAEAESYDDSSSPARRRRPIVRRMPSLRRLKQSAWDLKIPA